MNHKILITHISLIIPGAAVRLMIPGTAVFGSDNGYMNVRREKIP